MKRLTWFFSLLLFVWAPTSAQKTGNVTSHPLASTAADPGGAKLVPSAGPRVIQYRGSLVRVQRGVKTEVANIVFALNEQQDSTTPLWTETQNVELDEQGQYEVLLGTTKNEGLPLEPLFTNNRARWLAVEPTSAGLAAPARVLLVGVPYALKATDAEMLGGLPASAYALSTVSNGARSAEPSGTGSAVITAGPVKNLSVVTPQPGGTAGRIPKFSPADTIVDSSITDTGTNVGVGITAPANKLDVAGNIGATGLVSNGDTVLASAPRMIASAVLPGNLTGAARRIARIIPDKAITVDRVTVDLQTAASLTCSPPSLRVTDGTRGQDIFIPSGQTAFDSGVEAVLFPAGANVEIKLGGGALCSSGTPPAGANVLVQYRMQAASDTTACPSGTSVCSSFCTNTSFDVSNCGACGAACIVGPNSTTACGAGTTCA